MFICIFFAFNFECPGAIKAAAGGGNDGGLARTATGCVASSLSACLYSRNIIFKLLFK